MKKVLIVATAAAVLATSTLVSTPASAMFFLLPIVLQTKKDPNFHAQNPYETKKVARHHHHKKMKKNM